MSVLIHESTFGEKAQSLNDLAQQFETMDWYKRAGQKEANAEATIDRLMNELQVEEYELKWITKDETVAVTRQLTFEGSDIWERLKEVPDEMKKKIKKTKQMKLLETVVDTIPEFVFHHAFDAAVKQFKEEQIVNYLVCQAIYFSVLICSATLAGDDRFGPLLELLESGHVPLGLEGNTIYML